MYDQKITLTHLNVRQSIVILLTKLIVNDLLLAVTVIGFYLVITQGEQYYRAIITSTTLFLWIFILIGLLKISISIYIVLQWLNEYYEITPEAVIHKRGIINRKSEKYGLDKVRRISVHDTFLGEICNFATLTLYDVRLNKSLDMYLIHNPDRYAKILQILRPRLETQSDRKRLPFMPKRQELAEVED